MSLIATCQRHTVEPMAYLCDALTRIAATFIKQIKQPPDRGQSAPTTD